MAGGAKDKPKTGGGGGGGGAAPKISESTRRSKLSGVEKAWDALGNLGYALSEGVDGLSAILKGVPDGVKWTASTLKSISLDAWDLLTLKTPDKSLPIFVLIQNDSRLRGKTGVEREKIETKIRIEILTKETKKILENKKFTALFAEYNYIIGEVKRLEEIKPIRLLELERLHEQRRGIVARSGTAHAARGVGKVTLRRSGRRLSAAALLRQQRSSAVKISTVAIDNKIALAEADIDMIGNCPTYSVVDDPTTSTNLRVVEGPAKRINLIDRLNAIQTNRDFSIPANKLKQYITELVKNRDYLDSRNRKMEEEDASDDGGGSGCYQDDLDANGGVCP